MGFEEMCLAVDQISSNFDLAIERCELFAEASYNEYITNLQEAELKVIKESGTKDDADSLKGAASEGFIVRAQKTIQKIIDAFIQAMKALGNNIAAFFSKKENDAALKKINDKIKNDPKLGDKKIETADPKAFDTAEGKIDSIFQKIYAKAKNGKVTDSEVEAAVKESRETMNNAIKASITVSIAAVIAYITAHGKAMESDFEKRARILLHHETKDIAEADVDKLAAMSKAVTNHAKLKKQIAVEKFKRCVTEPFSKIKTMITGSGEVPQPKSVSESTGLDDILDSVFEQVELESEVNEMTASNILDNIEKELVESTEISDAEIELNAIESVLFESDDDNDDISDAEIELNAIESVLFESDDDNDDISDAEIELNAIESVLFESDDDGEEEEVAEESVDDILADLEGLL